MKRHRVVMYYIPFEAGTTVPVTEHALASHPNRITADIDTESLITLRTTLKSRLIKAKYNESFLRLIVYITPNEKYLVDNDGRVRNGHNDYYLRPGDFLKLYRFVSSLHRTTDVP